MDLNARIEYFARLLGWEDMKRCEHVIKADETIDPLRVGDVDVWYLSGDYEDIALDINPGPPWRACVYAMKYEICTAWHAFRLSDKLAELAAEADRLRPILAYEWFATEEKREEFRRQNPQWSGWTQDRVASTHRPIHPIPGTDS